MMILILIVCIQMSAGFFLIMNISPIEFADGLISLITKKSENIKDRINLETGRKKQSFIKKYLFADQRF